MIYVNRGKIKVPSVLVGPESLAGKELQRVIAFIREKPQAALAGAPAPVQVPAAGAPPGAPGGGKKIKRKSFNFTVYSYDEVKEALAMLFHGKCAYCETRYAPTQPVDVEHFRPKAAVDDDEAHPGYYWLAASWDNLLPSCIDCNRIRMQEIPAGTAADGEPKTEQQKLGKGSRFPLAAGSPRQRSPEDAVMETPLLLNPCVDNPGEMLEFTGDGIVRPKVAEGLARERACTSIEVYALNRTGLVANRLEVLRLVQAHMYTIKRLAEFLDQEADDSAGVGEEYGDVRVLVEELLSHEMAILDRFRDERQPYSLMCRQVIDRFVAELAGVEPETEEERGAVYAVGP